MGRGPYSCDSLQHTRAGGEVAPASSIYSGCVTLTSWLKASRLARQFGPSAVRIARTCLSWRAAVRYSSSACTMAAWGRGAIAADRRRISISSGVRTAMGPVSNTCTLRRKRARESGHFERSRSGAMQRRRWSSACPIGSHDGEAPVDVCARNAHGLYQWRPWPAGRCCVATVPGVCGWTSAWIH